MAEITSAGYQSIRTHMENNWNYIELRDDLGAAVLRLSTADPRVTWTHVPGAPVLELSVVIKGSDSDVSIPQKFASSVIYSQETGGEALTPAEAFSAFEMATTEDQITVRHRLEVPKVV